MASDYVCVLVSGLYAECRLYGVYCDDGLHFSYGKYYEQCIALGQNWFDLHCVMSNLMEIEWYVMDYDLQIIELIMVPW